MIVPNSPEQEPEILAFVKKCARYGVTTLFPATPRPDSFPQFASFGGRGATRTVMTLEDLYGGWDPIRVLVDAGKTSGLEVHPYLNVSYHGGDVPVAWSLDFVDPRLRPVEARRTLARHRPINSSVLPITLIGKFATDHPEFLKRDRHGKGSLELTGKMVLSLAFAEVRAFEVDVLLKIIRKSGAAGLQLEFVQEPVDTGGCVIYGYEEPALMAYQDRYGKDPLDLPNDEPAWVRLRSDYVTAFIRELRLKLRTFAPQAALTVAMIARRYSDYIRNFQDWPTWVAEGLIDGICLWFRTTADVNAVARQTREMADGIGGRLPLTVELSCYHPGSFQQPDLLLKAARIARENGADRLGVYRSQAVEQLSFWPVLKKISTL